MCPVGDKRRPGAVKQTKVWMKHLFLPVASSLLCHETSVQQISSFSTAQCSCWCTPYLIRDAVYHVFSQSQLSSDTVLVICFSNNLCKGHGR